MDQVRKRVESRRNLSEVDTVSQSCVRMVTYTSLRADMGFASQQNAPSTDGASNLAEVEKLDLGKNDNQGEQHQ